MLLTALQGIHDKILHVESKLEMLNTDTNQGNRMPIIVHGEQPTRDTYKRIQEIRNSSGFSKTRGKEDMVTMTKLKIWSARKMNDKTRTENVQKGREFQAKIKKIIPKDHSKMTDEVWNQLLDACELIKDEDVKVKQFKRDRLIRVYNGIWRDIMNYNINFHACFRDENLLTALDDANTRNWSMYYFFMGELQTVFNVFAGKGSDLFSWAVIPGIKTIYTNSNPLDRAILDLNIESFKKAFKKKNKGCNPPKMIINKYDPDVVNYEDIYLIPEKLPRFLDIVYMDPPWNPDNYLIYEPIEMPKHEKDPNAEPDDQYQQVLDSKVSKEAPLAYIMDYLVDFVLKPIFANEIYPRVLIVKARWENIDITPIEAKVPDYQHIDTVMCTPQNHTYAFYYFLYKGCRLQKMINGNYHNRRFRFVKQKEIQKYKKPGQNDSNACTNERNTDFGYVEQIDIKRPGKRFERFDPK